MNSDFTALEDGDFFNKVSFLQINPLSVRQFLFSHFPAKRIFDYTISKHIYTMQCWECSQFQQNHFLIFCKIIINFRGTIENYWLSNFTINAKENGTVFTSLTCGQFVVSPVGKVKRRIVRPLPSEHIKDE